MPVTDTDVIKEITYRVLENGDADADGVTLLTSMFSIPEIVDSMNRVQQKFMLDTGMILTRAAPIPVTVGNDRYDLPTDNSAVVRVSYTDFQSAPVPPTIVYALLFENADLIELDDDSGIILL